MRVYTRVGRRTTIGVGGCTWAVGAFIVLAVWVILAELLLLVVMAAGILAAIVTGYKLIRDHAQTTLRAMMVLTLLMTAEGCLVHWRQPHQWWYWVAWLTVVVWGFPALRVLWRTDKNKISSGGKPKAPSEVWRGYKGSLLDD